MTHEMLNANSLTLDTESPKQNSKLHSDSMNAVLIASPETTKESLSILNLCLHPNHSLNLDLKWANRDNCRKYVIKFQKHPAFPQNRAQSGEYEN